MKVRVLVRLVGLAVLGSAVAGFSADGPAMRPAAGRMDAGIDKALHEMSALLANAKSLSFECYAVSERVLPSGQKVDFARNQKVTLRRPDAVVANVVGDAEKFDFIYDGKTVTVFNGQEKVYAQTEAASTIDGTMDMLAEKYGMVLPLADMVYSDPYKALTERVRNAQDLGTGYVFQAKCRHFAFRQETVDWQIWVEEGAKPWPAKMVITYKDAPGQLEYTAYFRNWNAEAELAAESLKFTPPAEAKKIDFAVPATPPAGSNQ